MNDSIERQARFQVYMGRDDAVRFKGFLKMTGRQAAPFLRAKALEAVSEWESIQSGKTQFSLPDIRSLNVAVYCESCEAEIARQSGDGTRFEWTDPGAGVSEESGKELCGKCLRAENDHENTNDQD